MDLKTIKEIIIVNIFVIIVNIIFAIKNILENDMLFILLHIGLIINSIWVIYLHIDYKNKRNIKELE
ncbi:MAG: hypothetical protein IJH34_13595 [Romboutsia sp.]|nr:hypothetical protein [Romboutsia sp.]